MKPWPVLIAMVLVLAGCSDSSNDSETALKAGADRPVVCVTNYPLKYFAERIASPVVTVRFPVSGDGDPAYWKPGPEHVLALQQADLILLNGASYESWLKNVSLPQSKLVDTSAGLRDRLIALEEAATHSHGLEGEHEHSGTAFTTWLDLTLAEAESPAPGIRCKACSSRLQRRRPAVSSGGSALRFCCQPRPKMCWAARSGGLDPRPLH